MKLKLRREQGKPGLVDLATASLKFIILSHSYSISIIETGRINQFCS